MWGTKKPEPEIPAAFVPGPSKAAGISSIKPDSLSVRGEAMSGDPIRPFPTISAGTARLGASLHVKGKISGDEDLHIDGSVEGLIQLEERKLTVGTGAKVTADIAAGKVVVFGSVKGNLRASDRIEIKKDASVVGDLTTAHIMIEDGASFKGGVEIDRATSESNSREKDLDKPAYLRTAAGAMPHPSAPVSPASASVKRKN